MLIVILTDVNNALTVPPEECSSPSAVSISYEEK